MKDFVDKIRILTLKDGHYSTQAYIFVFEALEYTIQKMPERRHVTGKELLDGIKELAKKKFGFLSRMVFNQWGLQNTKDFGQIVFNLVDAGLMGKTDQDCIDDFKDGFDFNTAFLDAVNIMDES